MGMAKSPADMGKDVAATGRGPLATGGVVHRSARDDSPARQRLLRQALVEHEWRLFTWLLDTCELSARDDRAWKVQRRMMLDQFNKQNEVTRNLVNEILSLSTEQLTGMALVGQGRIEVKNGNG